MALCIPAVMVFVLTQMLMVSTEAASQSWFSIHQGDEVETYIQTGGNVYHMEQDLLIPGNIIYSDDVSLQTTDGLTSQTITRNAAAWEFSQSNRVNTTATGKFNSIRGFVQLSLLEVVVVDTSAHCLRKLNRETLEISLYAGQCGTSSFGQMNRFDLPQNIIRDIKSTKLFLTDYHMNSIKTVSTGNASIHEVSRFARVSKPIGIVQELVNGNFYITNPSYVYHIGYESKAVTLVGGSTDGSTDYWRFSVFKYPQDLIPISDNRLVVADSYNDRLKVMALQSSMDSVCTGEPGASDGKATECTLQSPRSLLLVNQTLYIGENGRIRQIEDKRSEICSSPSSIRYLSPVDSSFLGPSGDFHLPPGVYTFFVRDEVGNCNITLQIVDQKLKRRLSFKAVYNVSCDNVQYSMRWLEIMTQQNYRDIISDICDEDCSDYNSSTAVTMDCVDNSLTITMLTDKVYNGQETKIPTLVQNRLHRRLGAKGLAYYIVVLINNPPVVYPNQHGDGLYVEPYLTSYCEGDVTYDADNDTCTPNSEYRSPQTTPSD